MDSKGLRALLWVLVVSGCVVASLPAASIGAVADAGVSGATLQEDPSSQLNDADEIHINVFLTENGSAVFEVDYRYQLESENETVEDWEALRDEIESSPAAYTDAETDDWSTTLEEAENETDREMAISNATVEVDETRAPRHIGHVTFTFEWTSFANVVMNQIEAGDAISGFAMTDGTTLQIFGPEDYVVYERDPSPNEPVTAADDPSSPDEPADNSVFWSGDGTEFTDDQPRVVFIENGGTDEANADGDERLTTEWLAVLGALALLAAAAAVGWLVRHRQDDRPPTNGDVATTPVPDSASEPEGDGPPPELLSNEERVLRLLEDRGGRIKQQEVVSELDWTEAKTSQVVGRLREDGEIDVFRIGRENVLALPDDDLEE